MGCTLTAVSRGDPTYGTALVKVMTRSTVNSLNPLRLSNEFLETGGEAGKIVRSPERCSSPRPLPSDPAYTIAQRLPANNIGSPRLYTS